MAGATGKVVQVIGTVVDIEFPPDSLPGIYNAVEIDNNGETITLRAADGSLIETFRYEDDGQWPESPDGLGPSLTRILPPRAAQSPHSWRPSVAAGGSPGTSDAISFSGDPDADNDNDRISALLEHAHGTSDAAANPSALFSLRVMPLSLTLQQNLAADDIDWIIEESSDLNQWTPVSTLTISRTDNQDGTASVVYTGLAATGPDRFWRATAQLRE